MNTAKSTWDRFGGVYTKLTLQINLGQFTQNLTIAQEQMKTW